MRQKDEQRRATILRRELDWLKRGPRARTGKDKGRKRRIQELSDSRAQAQTAMQELTSTHRRLGKKVLEMLAVTKSYDGRQVLLPFTHSFRRGERIGIIGPNGSGRPRFSSWLPGRSPRTQAARPGGRRRCLPIFPRQAARKKGTSPSSIS